MEKKKKQQQQQKQNNNKIMKETFISRTANPISSSSRVLTHRVFNVVCSIQKECVARPPLSPLIIVFLFMKLETLFHGSFKKLPIFENKLLLNNGKRHTRTINLSKIITMWVGISIILFSFEDLTESSVIKD